MGSSELGFRKFLSAIIPDLAEATKRFPLEVLISAGLTAFLIFDIYEYLNLKDGEIFRISFALVSAFLWTLAVNLRAEKYKLGIYFSVALLLPGYAIIALLHSFPFLFEFNFALFLPALLLLVGLLPYIGKESEDQAFWLFNHRLWIGATLAIIGALAFSGGLSVVVKTVEALFTKEFPDTVHFNIWTIGMGFVLPLAWLSFIPSDLEEKVHIGRQKEFTSSAVGVIVKFILIPLLFLHTLILLAYTVKIGMDGYLPNDRIGILVLSYGLIGAVTILFAYPTHNSGGPLTKYFWRYWFAMSIIPVGLLSVAVFLRIYQYGFTSNRYIAWMMVLWLAVFAILFTIRREKRNLRLMTGVLAVFLLLASFGPWGARGIGARHQTAILEDILLKNNMLDNRQIKHVSANDSKKISPSDLRQIKSIIWYLQSQDNLNRLQPLFSDSKDSPFPLSEDKSRYTNANKVFSFLGIKKITKKLEGEYIEYYASTGPFSTPVKDYAVIAGPIEVALDKKAKKTDIRLGELKQKPLYASFSAKEIIIRSNGNRLSTTSIVDLMQNASVKLNRKKTKKQDSHGILFHKILGQKVPTAFMVERLSGKMRDNKVEDYSMRLWILVGE